MNTDFLMDGGQCLTAGLQPLPVQEMAVAINQDLIEAGFFALQQNGMLFNANIAILGAYCMAVGVLIGFFISLYVDVLKR